MVVLGDEAFQPIAHADDRAYAVAVEGLQHDGADDVVESRAEPAAGDDGRLGLAGVEIYLLTRAGKLQENRIAAHAAHVFAALFNVEIEGDGGIVDIGAYGRVLDLGFPHRFDVSVECVCHKSLRRRKYVFERRLSRKKLP